jgi:hypothetical protein
VKITIALAVLCLSTACAIVPSAGVAGPDAPFPECQADRYAFVGESSLAALGVNTFDGPDANRVGSVWITAEEVAVDIGPAPVPGGEPFVQEPSRMVCVEFADGSGMSGPIDDGWQPPGGPQAALAGGDAGFPPAPLIVVIVVAIVAGASFLAFRREPPA